MDIPEQDRYRVFFEASADAMLIINDGKFVDCNQSTLDMLGFKTKQELFDTHPAEISPDTQPDGQDSFSKANIYIERAMGGENCRFDWIHLRKDNTQFPVEVSLTAIEFSGKTILHVTWRDISKRIKLEQELIASRNSLQDTIVEQTRELNDAILEANLLGEAVSQSGTSIIITDQDGKIKYANPAFLENNGYAEEEVYGMTPRLISSGLHSKDFYRDMWKTIRNGKIWEGTLKNQRKNGEQYWAKLKIAPVTNGNSKINHFIGIETDITDFIEAKEKAEKANKAKSDFLSSMSHELRTPLNAIIGFSQLLEIDKAKTLSDNQKAQLFHIRNAGDHLLSLINEVLDLAKVEAGKLSFNIKNVNIRNILDECIEISEASYNRLNVRIENRISGRLPMLETDPLRTKQVILNLLSNAKKYNIVDGLVYVDCEKLSNDRFRINITDTGPGISEENQKKLFVPFNRLDAENSEIEGSGIGLVLTKKIVEGMNGEIGFASTVGQGSTFWIDFPINHIEEKKINGLDTIPTNFSLSCCDSQHTLLYVDDTPVNRHLMKELVSNVQNLDLICASTAKQGIELAEKHQPHMILMDIHLPDMNGYEAFEKLKKSQKTQNIPVVALSANAMPEAVERAKGLGFANYLTKPFKIPDLMTALDDVIEN